MVALAKLETPALAPAPVLAEVVTLPTATTPRQRSLAQRLAGFGGSAAERLLPPVLCIGLLIGLWELLCSGPGASLPPPSVVVAKSWELIFNPFFDRGGLEKG